ncbi:MAG: efflux RND transporter permease subunit [Clostridiaceae bacterium]
MGLTRYVLKRPVTTILALLCILVFGISSVFSATLEQMPDTDQPMLIVRASYSGATPEDMDELVTKPIEDQVSTLEGVKSMSSTSNEGNAMIMLEYDYDQDMDDAYNELTRSLNSIRGLPEDCNTSIMEMNMNGGNDIMLSITHDTQEDLYDYVDQNITPVFEQLSTVAQVESMGGSSEYVKVELDPVKMKQYKVTVNQITSAMAASDLSYPSGSAEYGDLPSRHNIAKAGTLNDLKKVPITQSGKIVYLEDIADVYTTEEQMGGVSRYNGQETISISVSKKQDSSAMKLSSDVKETVESLEAADSGLHIEIARDSADSIKSSLWMWPDDGSGVIISMIIIWLFFGDIKASLIVGSSIPTSILVSLILMTRVGFTLNVITMSALVLGVGMMVDNSIVVLESCFRAMDKMDGRGFVEYAKASLEGTGLVAMSVLGSTLTTCVVFIPLTTLNGMSGQMFTPLGWTIVFCMSASLLSAITVVPLTYMLYKPKEREKAPLSGLMKLLQFGYRKLLPTVLKHKAIVMLGSIGLVAATLFLASGMQSELMTSDDNGTISVTITTRPGLLDEKADDILTQVESIVSSHEDVDSYMLRYNGSSGTVSAYLKDDRKMSTDEIVAEWEDEMAGFANCTIEVEASASMSFMGRQNDYEVILDGSDYDTVKETADKIVSEMVARDDVKNVHSDVENTAPVVSINVDQVAASAEGLTAASIGQQVKQMLDGTEIATLTIDGNEVSVKAEYPEGMYRTVEQVKNMLITTGNGGTVAVSDVADVVFKDNPSSISKTDKAYEVTITADYVNGNVKNLIDSEVVQPNLSSGVTIGTNSRNRMMAEEFSSLYQAIAVAVFLVFVVMAAQFESPKFSFMVMTTIPFSLVGSFGLLKLTGTTISMTSILGFLILIGTVVNNGILYVDTVNQYRLTMDLKTALVEAGATRLRPILMTSSTTILSMIPMVLSTGSSASTTKGLAIVNIGGLTAGILVALFILPVYYAIMNGKKERKVLDI